MKYPGIILTVISIVLVFMAFKLLQIEQAFGPLSQNVRAVVDSNQALINANQRLESSFNSLRQEIADFKDKLPKK